jgi:hypothetical protein
MTVILALGAYDEAHRKRYDYAEAKLEVAV